MHYLRKQLTVVILLDNETAYITDYTAIQRVSRGFGSNLKLGDRKVGYYGQRGSESLYGGLGAELPVEVQGQSPQWK